MATKKLIITIHDFGLTNSVNQGVFDALANPANLVTNLSLLVTTPGFKSAAEFVKSGKVPEHISVDLCVSLTRNKPCLSTHKTLVDKNGFFKRANTLKWDFSIIDTYDEEEIKAEIRAQLECFVKATGRYPDALTTQRSEHGDPKILIPMVELAKELKIPLRTPAWRWLQNYAAKQYVLDNKVPTTDLVVVGVKDWKGKYGYDLDDDLDVLIEKLKSAENIAELLIFVGYVDKELFEYSSVTYQRAQYLDILHRRIEKLNKFKQEFELISYKEVR